MALCLPRRRRATSLATLPKTLSVASITNHSCVTSAGLALKVFMEDLKLRLPRDGASTIGSASAGGRSLALDSSLRCPKAPFPPRRNAKSP